MISRIKGTQDFLDLRLFNFLIDSTKKYLQSFNFIEIATTIIEPLELFKRSLGVETDVITKEMYVVQSTSETEDRICLRPEATASIMRAFIENGAQTTPWKVFSWGPMFRHERPQKGRYRQFHQITMEIIGSQSTAQDVYFITMLDRFFHERVSLINYALLINFLGCSEDRAAFKKILHEFLEKHTAQICENCMRRKETNIMRVFDCKVPTCQELYRSAPHIADNLCGTCSAEWEQIKTMLEQLSVTFSYAPSLVRGLDYYSKTVFEFVSTELGAQNAFCGGGRYDQLAQLIGARTDQPSIGAAIGIERILLLLEKVQNKLPITTLPSLHVIIPVFKEQQMLALLIADELHAQNIATEILLEGDSLKSMLRKANKLGAQNCIIIGEEEQKTHTVKLKNMTTGQEEQIAQAALIKKLKN